MWVAGSVGQVRIGSGGIQGVPVMASRSARMTSSPCLAAVAM
jgi:hypothetical protein